jgi:exodeoxyribonuclease-3
MVGTMKIISWNVNGIRAILKKNFNEFVKKEKPDILCIQETKAHPDQVDELLQEYNHHFWNSAEKKGYSGTAIFSKIKPKSVSYGIGKKEHDNEGRVITLELDKFYLVNVYTPNSGQELKRLKYRIEWNKDFLSYLKKLDKKKPVIICGDLNVAHKPIDLAHPKSNYNKTAGYTEPEIKGISKIFDSEFLDSFREFNDKSEQYSYWSYRMGARARNVGWRIDYFIVSKRLMKTIKKSDILSKIMGSDHCPTRIDINVIFNSK